MGETGAVKVGFELGSGGREVGGTDGHSGGFKGCDSWSTKSGLIDSGEFKFGEAGIVDFVEVGNIWGEWETKEFCGTEDFVENGKFCGEEGGAPQKYSQYESDWDKFRFDSRGAELFKSVK